MENPPYNLVSSGDASASLELSGFYHIWGSMQRFFDEAWPGLKRG
jgi:hypothetical protein